MTEAHVCEQLVMLMVHLDSSAEVEELCVDIMTVMLSNVSNRTDTQTVVWSLSDGILQVDRRKDCCNVRVVQHCSVQTWSHRDCPVSYCGHCQGLPAVSSADVISAQSWWTYVCLTAVHCYAQSTHEGSSYGSVVTPLSWDAYDSMVLMVEILFVTVCFVTKQMNLLSVDWYHLNGQPL